MLTTAPRGTSDIMPAEVKAWCYLEKIIRRICSLYGYKEIRTPIFEYTELFLRSIGETTDVVEKEMYTFLDRGGRSITLRPENTASVARSYIENKLYSEQPPVKLFYLGPMFRYDRPQAGRYRQFHQFGIEALGAPGPNIDAEIILLAVQVLETLGLENLKLKINSVGCPKCRPVYREKLQKFFRPYLKDMCTDCKSRFDRNPMRLLDCKKCHDMAVGAPSMVENLCYECREHFTGLKELLTTSGVSYEVDSSLVRGLDYYTKTAFEIQYTPLGAQSAVCGGGRYDGLIEQVGGDSTPAIGFAMGMERLLLALEKQKLLPEFDESIDIFVVCPKEETFRDVFAAANDLRKLGFKTGYDCIGKSMKSQMKQANKLKAKYVLIFGDDEFSRGMVILRNMVSSEQQEIPFNDITAILQAEVRKND